MPVLARDDQVCKWSLPWSSGSELKQGISPFPLLRKEYSFIYFLSLHHDPRLLHYSRVLLHFALRLCLILRLLFPAAAGPIPMAGSSGSGLLVELRQRQYPLIPRLHEPAVGMARVVGKVMFWEA